MIEKLSNKICNFLIKNQDVSEERKEIILYGITRVVEDVPKFIGIIACGFLFDILNEMLVVAIVTIIYKSFTGGVHAKTNISCFICSLITIFLTIYSSKLLLYFNVNVYFFTAMVYIFSIYTIVVYVPADVIEIPKINKKIRKSLKIKSLVTLNIIILISLFIIRNASIQYLVASSLLYIGLMTTRTIYNLFKTEYGFEAYIKEADIN